MSYIDVTGRSEEDAIQNALMKLGMDRDDVSVEILERAKSGFLGLGSAPAKVRVTYGVDEEPAAPQQAEQPKRADSASKTETPKKTEAPKRAEAPRRAAEPRTAETPRAPREPKTPRATEIKEPVLRQETFVPADNGEEVDDEKAQAIREFLSGLLSQMEISAQVKIYLPEKGRYRVLLVGDNLGSLIGRRGETLDAIQQLTSYSVNRAGSGRVRVQLDAENYRERREQSLQHLAEKVAAKVVKYRRSVTLEPMNAYERHVIHTALQEIPNVTTYSTGVEPNRRVIVGFDKDKR